MNLPRFQLSLRKLMEIVALVAITIWGSEAQRQSIHCQWRAIYHREEAEYLLEASKRPRVIYYCGTAGVPEDVPRQTNAEWKSECLRDAEFHLQNAAKYERASNRFWERFDDLPPDPPKH